MTWIVCLIILIELAARSLAGVTWSCYWTTELLRELFSGVGLIARATGLRCGRTLDLTHLFNLPICNTKLGSNLSVLIRDIVVVRSG